ncbi:MAG TPA: hypothetical protein ENK86_04330 [Campylobacterales bacterium]|nr:hypothetical protein [Campylobacterales bacterium]
MQRTVLVLALLGMTLSGNAREFPADEHGNVNVNVIDRQVIVNDQVVDTLEPGEAISVGNIDVDMDDDAMESDLDHEIEVDLDDDEISVDMGEEGISVDVDDEISVDMKGLIGDLIGGDE